MSLDPDRQIIQEIRNGQPRRFAVLVDRHKDRAMTLAVRIVGNREEAEELVQDSFVRAFRSLGEFRGDSRFGTWLYRILYNVCVTNVTRKRKQEAAEITEDNLLSELPSPEEETDILTRLEEDELRRRIGDAIETLPENQRTAVTMFYVQEMTYEEIARVTGQPMGTVKTNLFRGREALRRSVLRSGKGGLPNAR